MSDDAATYETAQENAERIGDLVDQLHRLGWEARPRAQHEALVAAVKVFAGYVRYGAWGDDAHCTLAACRAAGVDLALSAHETKEG